CALASSSSAVSCETTDNHQGNTGFDSHIRFGAVRPARKRSPKAALRERASDSPAAGRWSPASGFEIEHLERKRNMNYDILITIGVALGVLLAVLAALKFPRFRHAFLVPEGYAGLLYHKGKFVEVLGAGRHIRWGRHFTLDAQDLRKAALLVAGQEVLTADNVGLKLSLLVTYQVTDPVKAAHETQNWQGDLYNVAQLALRTVVGGVAVEALLNQRLEIGAQLLARVQPEAAKI